MSYILDALRKADAERERDPARGIHAQPLAAASPRAGSRAPAVWAAVAVIAVLAVGAGAALWPRETPVAAAPEAAPARAVPAPVASPVLSPAPPAAPATVPVAASAVSPPPPPALPPPVERPVAKAPPAALPASGARASAAAPAPASAPPSAASPAPERVYALAELPPDIQRELPKLSISGGVHSENAAQRMLIVGGQVMSEGAEVAPGLVLEQIRARTAVLRFRGYRYSVGF